MEEKNTEKIKLNLTVNDKQIELNPFVNEIIVSTIMGLIKPLKGVNDIRKITLTLEKKDENL